jgi:hypothetical protein
MDREDESELFGMGAGCTAHGDEFISECTMCGREFCARCARSKHLCPDCAAAPRQEAEEEGDDFADVPDLDSLLKENADDREGDR